MLENIVVVTLVPFGEKIFIGKYLMTLEVKVRHFGTTKSKMAPKIQDGGRKFWILSTKKLDMDLKNSQKKFGACFHHVISQAFLAFSACTLLGAK